MDVEAGGTRQPTPYSDRDRRAQLRSFAEACACAAKVFAEHGAADLGRVYRSLADAATSLLSEDFAQTDLRDLALALPARPDWLHPRPLDYRPARETWHEDAARHVVRAQDVAVALRAFAEYDA